MTFVARVICPLISPRRARVSTMFLKHVGRMIFRPYARKPDGDQWIRSTRTLCADRFSKIRGNTDPESDRFDRVEVNVVDTIGWFSG